MHATVVPLQRGRRRIERVPIREGAGLQAVAPRGTKKSRPRACSLLMMVPADGNQRQMRLLSLLLYGAHVLLTRISSPMKRHVRSFSEGL
jgi:hypothetical protein